VSESCHIFGIRHHGPGSAKSLRQALAALSPDCILIEGPPEAEELLSLASNEEMKPPMAILIHQADKPQRAVYYPFAIFSPEWQAIQFGLSAKVPVRFMDLPQTVQMGIALEEEAKRDREEEEKEGNEDENEDEDEAAGEGQAPQGTSEPPNPDHASRFTFHDPIAYLARAAGYSDSERWWEHNVEHRRDSADLFAGILEAMTALRDAAVQSQLQTREPEREAQREAWMRQTIRAAQKEGFQRIAVVCGVWHAPVLAKMPAAKDDAALLKGLPKVKVSATWIPWTYSRLAYASGYGAGIESPGWSRCAKSNCYPIAGIVAPKVVLPDGCWFG
jgi:hypothetical protein